MLLVYFTLLTWFTLALGRSGLQVVPFLQYLTGKAFGGPNKAFELDVLNVNTCNYSNLADSSAEGQETTLRQVLLIHRHGDRTVVNLPRKDKLANESFWDFHGYGQLTNRGKARLHLLGQLTRKRYEKFINRSVNKNMRFTRSSGSLRCVESAQVFLSSFLPLDASRSSLDANSLEWDSGCNMLGTLWQPSSLQTMAIPLDGMLAEGAKCPALDREYDDVIDKTFEARLISEEFRKEAEVLKEVLDYDVDYFYKWYWISGKLEVERSYFGDRLDRRILDIYDRVQEAGRIALMLHQSTVTSKRLKGGLLINDMIKNMKSYREQSEAPQQNRVPKKIMHYVSHDLNVLVLLGMLDNVRRYPFGPHYAAHIIFELHQDGSEWFVKCFYMPHVPSKLNEVHIDACEVDHPKRLCTLDKLEQIMQPYIIKNWLEWMGECGNDLYTINPYTPNH